MPNNMRIMLSIDGLTGVSSPSIIGIAWNVDGEVQLKHPLTDTSVVSKLRGAGESGRF